MSIIKLTKRLGRVILHPKRRAGTNPAQPYRISDQSGDCEGALNPNKTTKGRFCPNPFRQLDVYESGDVHLCCSSWLPTPIGNLKKQEVAAVWNSDTAQEIRASIFDGSFRFCNHRVCPVIQDGRLPTLEEARKDPDMREIIESRATVLPELPTFVNLCNDASCNLWCPSCRAERINHTKGKEFDQRLHLQDKIVQAMFSEPTDRHFRLNVTGSGDPFASRVFREFLFGLDGARFPNLRISLQTNGVLLTPRSWQRMEKIHGNIDTVVVSFDAATPETYAVTRRGGHWETLISNTRALGEQRREGRLKYLRMDFVVQQANYREMPAFVDLAESVGADHACFSMILDWGTWPKHVFDIQCIWKQTHPEFPRFLEVMQHPALGRENVLLGNLASYREQPAAPAVAQSAM